MIASERFARIEEIVKNKGFASTRSLASWLGVSETTIRRDCEDLEDKGVLVRVHGGVRSAAGSSILSTRDEVLMRNRLTINSAAKDQVSKKAAAFVEDGDCIFLDGGSSIIPMLKALEDKKLKIVTNSIFLASAYSSEGSEIFVLGGKFIPDYLMNVGQLTLMELEHFSFDHAFISCTGVDIRKHLVYTSEMDTTAVKQKAMEKSVHKYLLIDDSKLDVHGFCGFIRTDEFDAVICNDFETAYEDEFPYNFLFNESDEKQV